MKQLQPFTKPVIDLTQLVKYAGASGDFNPIHTVVPIAEESGHKGVIAHGMLIMAFAAQAITRWFPQKKLKYFKVRFRAMTYPGEQLIIEGKLVTEKVEACDDFLLGELKVKDKSGSIKLIGQFEVISDYRHHQD